MNGSGQTVFAGLSAEELAALLGQLEHRRFAAGSCVLQEGDNPSAMYIIRSGTAEVLISDRFGASHRVDQAGPGEVLGEMSLLTGQPVSATVRALTDVDALVIEGADFERVAGEFPLIFRNLGVVLANRLRRSNLRALRPHANTILLRDSGAPTPALLAWALACSMASHVRRPVLLVVPAAARPEELEPLASLPAFDPARPPGSGASLLVARPGGEFAPEALPATLDRLSHSYDYILFLSSDGEAAQPLPGLQARTVDLAGPRYIPEARAPGSAAASRQPWHTLRAWASGGPAQRPGPDGALDVPPLQDADLGALRSGLLPPGTPASRALGWAARELCGLKVGLALGAGSEKGYAHIGVARVLQRAGVPLDYLAGTSIGASVAAALADEYSLVELERIFTDVARAAFRLRLPGASLLSSAGMRDRLRAAAGGRRFEELLVPLAIVAADLVTGREIVFRRESSCLR